MYHRAPGLLATRADATTGRLSMSEVAGLRLRARLVVLSECDSFRGRATADGVIGIARAFIAAGAPTLVASLWHVDDFATRVLMGRFYRNLLGEHAAGDAAAALRAAMLEMLREGGGPGFPIEHWAAFVVYGLAEPPPSPLPDAASAAEYDIDGEEAELQAAIRLSQQPLDTSIPARPNMRWQQRTVIDLDDVDNQPSGERATIDTARRSGPPVSQASVLMDGHNERERMRRARLARFA